MKGIEKDLKDLKNQSLLCGEVLDNTKSFVTSEQLPKNTNNVINKDSNTSTAEVILSNNNVCSRSKENEVIDNEVEVPTDVSNIPNNSSETHHQISWHLIIIVLELMKKAKEQMELKLMQSRRL